MKRENLFFIEHIRRFLTVFVCLVMAAAVIPGVSAPVFAAEVKGARLLIQVQGEDGYRVPELSIYYLPPNTPAGIEPRSLGKTDARGELVFTELEEGEFQFFYNVPNVKSKVRVPYTIKDINGRPTLTISDPRLIGDKDAETVEDASLNLDVVGFQVVDTQGSPVPNTKLAFWRCPSASCNKNTTDGHELVFTTITDREGNCARSGLPTGNYHIKATVYDEYHQEQFSEMTLITIALEDEKQSRTIPLSYSKTASKQPESGVLTIYFENEGEKPQADIRVGYQKPGSNEDFWLGCTDAEGKVAISNLQKGTYTFFYYLDFDNNKNENRTDFQYEVEDPSASDSVTVKTPIPTISNKSYLSPLEKWIYDNSVENRERNIQTGFAEEIYGKELPDVTIYVSDTNNQPAKDAKVEIYCVAPYNIAGNTKGESKLMSVGYVDDEGKVVFSDCHAGQWSIRIYCKDEFKRDKLTGDHDLTVLDDQTSLTWNLYTDGRINRPNLW